MEIVEILQKQRLAFQNGKTLAIETRIQLLKKLYNTIERYEQEILDALMIDLGKCNFEAYMCEIGLSKTEITYMIQNIPKFAKRKYVKTPLSQFPARSYKKLVPYGNTLIMSPWNYPFLLTIDPLVDAIAAGNTAIVKPSAYSPATSEIVKKIIQEAFDEEIVAVVTGGRKENAELLKQKFDFIFFTGSQGVGKEVLRNAAEHLTPVVLELGGKSPCIVDQTANIPLAAKRIVFGKYINCGQTCVAPDYVLCHSSIKNQLVQEIKKQIEIQYTNNPLENTNYGHIINTRHFERLCTLIDDKKVAHGGKSNPETNQIEPTLMIDVTWNDAVMHDEIFGPILPILTFESIDEIIELMHQQQHPLALYLFTEDKPTITKVTEHIQFGGGCINDCLSHLASTELGFGGVGGSGMGSYHGRAGFESFSHTKNILDKKTWLDLPMRYRPYRRKRYEKIVKFFLK